MEWRWVQVNLALKALPRFTCLPIEQGQHNGTIHLLPQDDVIASVRRSFAQACAGELPDFPTMEWYIHTGVDPSLQDKRGHHSSAFFVQWVPQTPKVWDRMYPHLNLLPASAIYADTVLVRAAQQAGSEMRKGNARHAACLKN